jgi:DNA-binding protein HU-beta
MTRTELIAALAKETEMEKKETKIFLESLTTLVEKTLKKGGEVPLKGLGKFKVQKRKARMGRNPATGEPIKIPAKTVVKFTVAKSLKDLVLKKRKK